MKSHYIYLYTTSVLLAIAAAVWKYVDNFIGCGCRNFCQLAGLLYAHYFAHYRLVLPIRIRMGKEERRTAPAT